jgi:outer membrane biosynthesis protein TonB
MARLIVRREPRGAGDGVPARAVVGSLSVHAIVLIFMFWGANRLAIPPPPQVYQVELVAAPREAPVRAVPVPDRPRPAPEEKPQARPVETKVAPAKKQRQESRPIEPERGREAAEEEPKPQVEVKPAATPEQSREGVEGTPVRLEGAPFPYPEYLANVILQIKRHWRPPAGGRLRAELAFTIKRDGSVGDVAWVRRSGSPAFDLEARGAIEAAGRRGTFGPLPDDYPSDRLRISFFFDPTRY